MTAISVKVCKDTPPQRKRLLHRLKVLIRVLIILCTALSIVLSAVALYDGRWLQTDVGMFGLFDFCSTEPGCPPLDFFVHPNCTSRLGLSSVCRVRAAMSLGCALVWLAAVAATCSLQYLVISQVSTGEDSARRWALGSALLLMASSASASGVFLFLVVLWQFVSPTSVTLALWCQLTSIVVLLLSGLAATQVRRTNVPDPHAGFL